MRAQLEQIKRLPTKWCLPAARDAYRNFYFVSKYRISFGHNRGPYDTLSKVELIAYVMCPSGESHQHRQCSLSAVNTAVRVCW